MADKWQPVQSYRAQFSITMPNPARQVGFGDLPPETTIRELALICHALGIDPHGIKLVPKGGNTL